MMNTTLSSLSMRPMIGAEFTTFLEHVDMSDISDAIKKVKQNNQGAKMYIRKQVVKVFNGWTKEPVNELPQSASSNSPASNAPASEQPLSSQAKTEEQEQETSSPDPIPADERKYFDHKVFGGKSVIGFYARTDQNNHPCIYMEAASVNSLNNTRKCDWDNKLVLKITKQEMPVVMQVLLGYKTECKFNCHGEAKDKGFAFKKQEGKFFLQVSAKNVNHSLPMLDADANYVFALFLKQWLQYHPWMSDSGAMMALRSINMT